jgi:hypothetical protein
LISPSLTLAPLSLFFLFNQSCVLCTENRRKKMKKKPLYVLAAHNFRYPFFFPENNEPDGGVVISAKENPRKEACRGEGERAN